MVCVGNVALFATFVYFFYSHLPKFWPKILYFSKNGKFAAIALLGCFIYIKKMNWLTIPKLTVIFALFLLGLGFYLTAAQYKITLIFAGFLYLGAIYYLVPPRDEERSRLARLKGGSKSSGSHGSADFANTSDLRQNKLFQKEGFLLGKYSGRFMRFNDAGHLLTFAPTRMGKGVGLVIPNLLSYEGSVVVNDIKGENYAITGEFRKQFSKVVTFDPFERGGQPSSHYNPMDFIRINTKDELEDAALITDLIVPEASDAKDPFWDKAGKELVTALILHVAHNMPPALRNLGEVRHIVTLPAKELQLIFREMMLSNNQLLKKLGESVSGHEAKVLASILSTVKAKTQVWDSAHLKAITAKSTFQPEELKRNIVSFYFIIPPDQLTYYKPIVRLMNGILLATMLRTHGQPKKRILFLIDEFPALGYMEQIETGIGYLAGYGVSLWLFVQDLSQLKANYDKWETFISNCRVRMAFGTSDVETAKVLSDMMGNTTIKVDSSGVSKDGGFSLPFSGGKSSVSSNTSETSRALMTPDEIMNMSNEKQLIFIQGMRPILAQKIRYYADKAFKGKYAKWHG